MTPRFFDVPTTGFVFVGNGPVFETRRLFRRDRNHAEVSVADAGPLHRAVNRIAIDGLRHDRLKSQAFQHPIDRSGIATIGVDFGGTNRDQRFQLLAHTREDGVLGGVTSWAGKDWPVEGRMSQNLYTVQQDGLLRWYRHTGRSNLTFQWDEPKVVGSGWSAFRALFGGGDGVIYAIQPDGVLLWYYHDGRNQGTFNWQGAKQIGTGWHTFRQVFAGDGGVIYALRSDGILLWYRHLGRRDGSTVWQGPFQVGTGWNSFITVGAGPDGCLYGILRDGRLLWYRHWGHDEGYPIWTGRTQVGSGWQEFDSIWAVGNGYVYGRTIFGDLWLWRHHGFLTGEGTWTQGAKVGVGWGGNMVAVFAT